MTKQPAVDRLGRRFRLHADNGTGVEGPTKFSRHVLKADHYEVRNETAEPLDAYAYGGFITNEQFNAGDQVRVLWTRAGREPKMIRDLELVGHSSEGMSEAQSEAWHELVDLMKPLIPFHQSMIENVCLYGKGAEGVAREWNQPDWLGLLMLRDALSTLTGR